MFTVFLGIMRDFNLAHGIWHCIRSDATQNQMLLAATQATLDGNKRLLNKIAWSVEVAAKLASMRNDLIHTGLTLLPDDSKDALRTLPDFVAGKRESVQRLTNTDDKTWTKVAGDLRALEGYVRMIGMEVMGAGAPSPLGSWPRKPRLQSIPKLGRGGQKRRRPATKKAKR